MHTDSYPRGSWHTVKLCPFLPCHEVQFLMLLLLTKGSTAMKLMEKRALVQAQNDIPLYQRPCQRHKDLAGSLRRGRWASALLGPGSSEVPVTPAECQKPKAATGSASALEQSRHSRPRRTHVFLTHLQVKAHTDAHSRSVIYPPKPKSSFFPFNSSIFLLWPPFV